MFEEEDFDKMWQSYDEFAVPDGIIDCSDFAMVPLSIIALLKNTELSSEISRSTMLMKLTNLLSSTNQDAECFIITLGAMLLTVLEQLDDDSRVMFYEHFVDVAEYLENDVVPFWGDLDEGRK